MADIQTSNDAKIKRIMWWLAVDPTHLGQWQLEQLDQQAPDHLKPLAKALITSGRQAVIQGQNPYLISLLDDIMTTGRPGRAIIDRHFEKTGGELARDFWPDKDPVLTVRFSHFSGSYPNKTHSHTCKSYWVASGQGNQVTKIAYVNFSLWREVITKEGERLYCPACWHERVVGFCRQIEKATQRYTDLTALAYVQMSEAEYKTQAATIRKHNQRARENGRAETTAVQFPTAEGVTMLHDAPDWLGGDKLPNDRRELFNLVEKWANTPKGKRAGRGLATWGVKLDKEAKTAKKTGNDTDQENNAPEKWRIIGKGWGKLNFAVAAYFDKKPTKKGWRFQRNELTVSEFQEILTAANITDFATVEGNVTLIQCKQAHYLYSSNKCDNLPPPIGANPDPLPKWAQEPAPLGDLSW